MIHEGWASLLCVYCLAEHARRFGTRQVRGAIRCPGGSRAKLAGADPHLKTTRAAFKQTEKQTRRAFEPAVLFPPRTSNDDDNDDNDDDNNDGDDNDDSDGGTGGATGGGGTGGDGGHGEAGELAA